MAEPDKNLAEERRSARPWTDRLARLYRYRLVVPIKRSNHSPEHAARGVMIGLMWGLTPTVGAQMIFCFFTWVIAKKVFKWDFGLIISLAWTWTTNFVTLVPAYYLFFVTGQVMLGRMGELSGYDEFASTWGEAIAENPDISFLHGVWTYIVMLLEGWGLPMLVGCVPWSILAGWVGYKWSLRFIERHRAAKLRRAARRQAAEAGRTTS